MFRPQFLLFQQEGYLFQANLTQGLTALRNANLNAKGLYYSAFFQLSIGLERLMKVIVIIDHAAKNSLAFPTNDELRNRFRHDLGRLLDAVRNISVPGNTHPLDYLTPQTVTAQIISFLSEFAKTSRYYNLDFLTDQSKTEDPLRKWNTILRSIVLADPPRQT